MKKYCFILALLTLIPGALFSQAGTDHQKYEFEFEFDYYDNWVVHLDYQLVVNQVSKINKAGDTEVRYTFHFNKHWVYTNTVTGERKVGPETENLSGVTYSGADHSAGESHTVYHYVNDPVFGAYHINSKVLWTYNEASGYIEVIDIQNEWVKN